MVWSAMVGFKENFAKKNYYLIFKMTSPVGYLICDFLDSDLTGLEKSHVR